MTSKTENVNIQPPNNFDFSNPSKWNVWLRSFERYRLQSELSRECEENQVATMVFCMGEQAEKMLRSFGLGVEEKKKYDTVLDKFKTYFEPKVNYIRERAILNVMTQRIGQSVAEYAVALKIQALCCGYDTPAHRDEAIRDRFVVGITDKKVCRKLQDDPQLTLELAIQRAVNWEGFEQKQLDMNNINQNVIADSVHKVKSVNTELNKNKKLPSKIQAQLGISTQCRFCGRKQHAKTECPAKDENCCICGKKGHFADVCKYKTSGENIQEQEKNELLAGAIAALAELKPMSKNDFQAGPKIKFGPTTGALTAHFNSEYHQSLTNVRVQNRQLSVPQHLYGPPKMAAIHAQPRGKTVGDEPCSVPNADLSCSITGQPFMGGANIKGHPLGAEGQYPSQPVPQQASIIQEQECWDQKQLLLRQRLFPVIQRMYPEVGGKIVGKLLEMDNSELLHLLGHRESLKPKLDELAMLVNEEEMLDTWRKNI